VRFEYSGVVRVLYDRLIDGRYIVRAVGAANEFEIFDDELDFAWKPDMKPRRVWTA
jgi:hypothetical protein